ncbi:MAG: ion channel, partial [Caulobacteraceae bacterium]
MVGKPQRSPEPVAAHPAGHAVIGDFRLRKTGVSRYDLRDPYYTAVTAPWWAFILAVLALVFLINTVFALLYLAEPGAVQNLKAGQFWMALFFSIETLSTVGYGEM